MTPGSSAIPGGKDSTLVAQLVFEMLLDLAPSDRKRPVHLLCNDTLVESPVLMAYIDRMLARLQTAAESLHLPITVVKTTPDPGPDFLGEPHRSRVSRTDTDVQVVYRPDEDRTHLELHPHPNFTEAAKSSYCLAFAGQSPPTGRSS